MALRGTAFGKDDVAALEVVADRKAGFTHKLNLTRLDLKWILDTVPVPTGARPSTPVRGAPSSLDTVSPIREEPRGQSAPPRSDASAPSSSRRDNQDAGNSTEGGLSGRKKGRSQSEVSPARSEATTIRTTTSSVMRLGRQNVTFVDPPATFLTLLELDRNECVDEATGGVVQPPLINSPRSAFVILKNGFSIPELCAVPLQEYYNKALLDGVSLETVKMRIAAEEERREKRCATLQKAYGILCKSVSREEVVDAIRTHKFADVLNKAADEERLKSISHYAHPGKYDLSILDGDCIEVLERSRARTMNEIRRGLDQRDRMLKQSLEKENALLEKERAAHEEAARTQGEAARQRDARAEAYRERRREVEQRVDKILATQEELTELRRQALIAQDEIQARKAQEKKEFQKTASQALIDERDRRRRQVRAEHETMLNDRREELISRAELHARMKERETQLRKERQHAVNAERAEKTQKRRQTIRELADHTKAELLRQQSEVEALAEARTKEFSRRRELRYVVKRKRAQQRAERTVTTRMHGELIKERRMAELEREFEEKLRGIEQAQREKLERIALSREMSAQVQLEKTQEKERAANADEFSKVAYVSSSNAKKRWMDQAHMKRSVLTLQVRQEREAMIRAKEQLFAEMEEQEIMRRKKAAEEMLLLNVK